MAGVVEVVEAPCPYATPAYWNERYRAAAEADAESERDARTFEWLADAEEARRLVRTTAAGARLVELGCGNSTVAEGMAMAGFDVLAVDFSERCVAMMEERRDELNAARAAPLTLRFAVADCRDLGAQVAAASADVVFDKGLVDAVLNEHDQHAWFEKCNARKQPPPPNPYDGPGSAADARRVVAEAARILKDGGEFVVVSYEPPAGRLKFFDDADVWMADANTPYEDERGNFVYRFYRRRRRATGAEDTVDELGMD